LIATAILVALAAWLGALLWAQRAGGAFGFRLARMLAPQWGLFTAPVPWLSMVALYRVEDEGGPASEWLELPPRRAPTGYEAPWGLERRYGKIHADLAGELVQARLALPRPQVAECRAYRALLDQARHAAQGAGGSVRFCLRTEDPDWPAERPRIVFLSEAHPL
jgi:hypothetical protein